MAKIWTAMMKGWTSARWLSFDSPRSSHHTTMSAPGMAVRLPSAPADEPIAAIPLMMFCSIASQSMSLVKVYPLIRWRALAPLLIRGMAGAAVAVPLMATVHPHSFRIAFGLFLAGYALYMLMRHLLIRRPLAPAAGAASLPAPSLVGVAAGARRGPPPRPRALSRRVWGARGRL